MGMLFVKTLPRGPQKPKARSTDDPAVPQLGIYAKISSPSHHRALGTALLTVALFTTAELWSQPGGPSTEDGQRQCGIYAQ